MTGEMFQKLFIYLTLTIFTIGFFLGVRAMFREANCDARETESLRKLRDSLRKKETPR